MGGELRRPYSRCCMRSLRFFSGELKEEGAPKYYEGMIQKISQRFGPGGPEGC